jgi:hypothetical protein
MGEGTGYIGSVSNRCFLPILDDDDPAEASGEDLAASSSQADGDSPALFGELPRLAVLLDAWKKTKGPPGKRDPYHDKLGLYAASAFALLCESLNDRRDETASPKVITATLDDQFHELGHLTQKVQRAKSAKGQPEPTKRRFIDSICNMASSLLSILIDPTGMSLILGGLGLVRSIAPEESDVAQIARSVGDILSPMTTTIRLVVQSLDPKLDVKPRGMDNFLLGLLEASTRGPALGDNFGYGGYIPPPDVSGPGYSL